MLGGKTSPYLTKLADRVEQLGKRRKELHERWLGLSAGHELSDALFEAYVDARDAEVAALRSFHSGWVATQRTDDGALEAQLAASLEGIRV